MTAQEDGQQQQQSGVEAIPVIFERVQSGEWSVERGVRDLGRVYHGGARGCHTALASCLEVVARAPGAPASVQRSLQLFVAFASAEPPQHQEAAGPAAARPPLSRADSTTGFVCWWPNDEYAHWLVRTALDATRAAERGARAVACELLCGLLDACAPPAASCAHFPAQDELLGAVLLRLRARVVDRAAGVRAAAVRALRRLQDPRDALGDPVHACLVRALQRDPAAPVRLAALHAVAPTPRAVPALVARVRDVAPAVRAAALRRVFAACAPAALAPEHVRTLVAVLAAPKGDRSEGDSDARTARRLYRRAWLHGRDCAGSPLRLLAALGASALPDGLDTVAAEAALADDDNDSDGDCCAYDIVCECCADTAAETSVYRMTVTLRGGADTEDSAQQTTMAWEAEGAPLTPVMALLWRVACQHRWCRVPGLRAAAALLAAAVAAYTRTRRADDRYSLLQVLGIVAAAVSSGSASGDNSDREQLETQLRRAVPALADEPVVLEPAMDALRTLLRDEAEWTRVVVEVVADLMDPLDGSSSGGSSAPAAEPEAEREGGGETRGRLLPAAAVCMRGLHVVAHYLRQTTRDLGDPMASSFLRSVILPALAHTEPGVRQGAVRALGLACVLSVAASTQFLPLLAHALAVDVLPVRRAALEVVLDVVLAHGPRALGLRATLTLDLFHRTAFTDAERRDLLLLAAVRALDERALRDTAVEGLAKAFFVGAVRCPLVLARLLVLRFDALVAPTLGAGARACLAAFFPAYVAGPRFAARHRAVVEDALARAVQWGCSFNASRGTREPRHVALRDMAAYALGTLLAADPAAPARALAALLALLARRPKCVAPAAPLLPLFRVPRATVAALDPALAHTLAQHAAQLLAQHRALLAATDDAAVDHLQVLCARLHEAHPESDIADSAEEPPAKRACAAEHDE